MSTNVYLANKNNPVSASSANTPEPSPTNEESPVEFDTVEEHAAAASATQKAPTANMMNDNDIDSQLAMENEYDSNDAPFFTIQFATFVTFKRNVKAANQKIRLAGMRQHLYGNIPAQKKWHTRIQLAKPSLRKKVKSIRWVCLKKLINPLPKADRKRESLTRHSYPYGYDLSLIHI